MTNPVKITTFLTTHKGIKYCDDDLAKLLNLPRRQEVQQATSALATTPNFKREKGQGSVCRNIKCVIYSL
jgi:hypothetical protein